MEIEERQTTNFYVKENEAAKLMRQKGIQAANLLVKEKTDAVLAGDLGEGPFHVLGDSLMQIYSLPRVMEIKEAIRLLNQKLLERMASPSERYEEDRNE